MPPYTRDKAGALHPVKNPETERARRTNRYQKDILKRIEVLEEKVERLEHDNRQMSRRLSAAELQRTIFGPAE